MARLNRDLLEAEISLATVKNDVGELKLAPAPGAAPAAGQHGAGIFANERFLARESLPSVQSSAMVLPGSPPSVQSSAMDLPGSPPSVQSSATVMRGSPPSVQSSATVMRGSPPSVQSSATVMRGSPPLTPPSQGGESDRAARGGDGSSGGPVRVAILSFLFNWPSTGGGNHHTAELAAFLARAGYEVKHFFARYPGWGIGRVTDALISPSEAIAFDDSSWNVAEIQARFRQAVDAFAPDYVMITDAWNMKPYLAEAVRGYPYFLLYQAQENLCPLNNLRLLATGPTTVEQCPRNQLATPEVCCRCLAERGGHSGALHRAERELAGVGTQEYYGKLRQSLMDAEAVLVLNPVIAAMVEPYAAGCASCRGAWTRRGFRGRSGNDAGAGDVTDRTGEGEALTELRRCRRQTVQPARTEARRPGRNRAPRSDREARAARATNMEKPPRRRGCSWRPWPARRSRGITSRMRLAGSCGKIAPTSSWS